MKKQLPVLIKGLMTNLIHFNDKQNGCIKLMQLADLHNERQTIKSTLHQTI